MGLAPPFLLAEAFCVSVRDLTWHMHHRHDHGGASLTMIWNDLCQRVFCSFSNSTSLAHQEILGTVPILFGWALAVGLGGLHSAQCFSYNSSRRSFQEMFLADGHSINLGRNHDAD